MTRTATNKLIAIFMAVFMALALMSFSMSARAEDESADPTDPSSSTSSSTSSTTSTTATEKTAPTPEISITTYTYGAPDLNVKIEFKDATPKFDYANWSKTENLKILMDAIKLYSDKDLTKEVTISNKQLSNVKFENNTASFTVPLSKANGLSASTTYYLFLGDVLNETTEANGESTYFEFKTNTTTTSTRTTTRTTYRTVTTKATTVRAKSANTGDPSNLPVWIGLAVVAAILGGIVVVNKEKE